MTLSMDKKINKSNEQNNGWMDG